MAKRSMGCLVCVTTRFARAFACTAACSVRVLCMQGKRPVRAFSMHGNALCAGVLHAHCSMSYRKAYAVRLAFASACSFAAKKAHKR